jgi:hypothetical protein
MEVRAFMNARVRSFSSWLVVLCFLFATLYPQDAPAFFDTDTLKTTGIIMGITFGVALVVVLVVGTMRDLKKDKDEDHDDVWSQSPVLRTLGYRPGDFPFSAETPLAAGGPLENGLVTEEEIERFLKARVDRIGLSKPPQRHIQDPHGFTLGWVPSKPTLSNPPAGQERILPPFSLRQANDRS